MASTASEPTKSTRHMDGDELKAEAARLGIGVSADLERLRATVKAELERRWIEDNSQAIAANKAWVEKNGLPLAKYRMF